MQESVQAKFEKITGTLKNNFASLHYAKFEHS